MESHVEAAERRVREQRHRLRKQIELIHLLTGQGLLIDREKPILRKMRGRYEECRRHLSTLLDARRNNRRQRAARPRRAGSS